MINLTGNTSIIRCENINKTIAGHVIAGKTFFMTLSLDEQNKMLLDSIKNIELDGEPQPDAEEIACLT